MPKKCPQNFRNMFSKTIKKAQKDSLCFPFTFFSVCRIDGINTTVKSIDLTSWPANCGGESRRINFLEHALLVISFNYTLRNLIEVELEAPTGTKSLILRSGNEPVPFIVYRGWAML